MCFIRSPNARILPAALLVVQYFARCSDMALCGLWHGASWTFLLWGTLHGVAADDLRIVAAPIVQNCRRCSVGC